MLGRLPRWGLIMASNPVLATCGHLRSRVLRRVAWCRNPVTVRMRYGRRAECSWVDVVKIAGLLIPTQWRVRQRLILKRRVRILLCHYRSHRSVCRGQGWLELLMRGRHIKWPAGRRALECLSRDLVLLNCSGSLEAIEGDGRNLQTHDFGKIWRLLGALLVLILMFILEGVGFIKIITSFNISVNKSKILGPSYESSSLEANGEAPTPRLSRLALLVRSLLPEESLKRFLALSFLDER